MPKKLMVSRKTNVPGSGKTQAHQNSKSSGGIFPERCSTTFKQPFASCDASVPDTSLGVKDPFRDNGWRKSMPTQLSFFEGPNTLPLSDGADVSLAYHVVNYATDVATGVRRNTTASVSAFLADLAFRGLISAKRPTARAFILMVKMALQPMATGEESMKRLKTENLAHNMAGYWLSCSIDTVTAQIPLTPIRPEPKRPVVCGITGRQPSLRGSIERQLRAARKSVADGGKGA